MAHLGDVDSTSKFMEGRGGAFPIIREGGKGDFWKNPVVSTGIESVGADPREGRRASKPHQQRAPASPPPAQCPSPGSCTGKNQAPWGNGRVWGREKQTRPKQVTVPEKKTQLGEQEELAEPRRNRPEGAPTGQSWDSMIKLTTLSQSTLPVK